MQSIKERLRDVATGLSAPTDSDVVHLRTLRTAIGVLGVALPFALTAGENLRDWYLTSEGEIGRTMIEGSISAYYHTGMREVFVGILSALAIFLLCYKGPQKWDVVASKIAGAAALFVAILPTRESARESVDVGIPAPNSVTLFSGHDALDPPIINNLHYASATVFFITVAIMSLYLFTKSGAAEPTPHKLQRNKVFRLCGATILLAIAAIAVDKLLFDAAWSRGTSFVFWMETIAVMAFGIAWLTKAEVLFGDRSRGVPAGISEGMTSRDEAGKVGVAD